MFTKYIEFVFFSFLLVLSCQKKYQFDLSEITETDLNGNLIGNVNPNDWKILSISEASDFDKKVFNNLNNVSSFNFDNLKTLFFAAFTLIVIFLAVWRPEVLQGTRNWDKTFSDRLSDDIYFSVEGYLDNLSEQEKIEAFLSLSDILATQDSGNDEFNMFCKRMSERITKKAELSNKKLKTQGTISI